MMIDERKFELETRLWAIEWLLHRVLSMQMSMLGEERAESLADIWRDQLNAMTVPEYPPEISDAFAATVRDRIEDAMNEALQAVRAANELLRREK